MIELLVYEIISDFRSRGIDDVPIDEDCLAIDWVDDLEYIDEADDDDYEEEEDV